MFRTEWFHKAANGRSVLEIAGDVSSMYRGSMEYRYETMYRDVRLLKQIIDEWKEPYPQHRGRYFDVLVKKLILEAIDEGEIDLGFMKTQNYPVLHFCVENEYLSEEDFTEEEQEMWSKERTCEEHMKIVRG